MGLFEGRGSDRSVRRYKVTYFGEGLGTFALPVGEHLENPDALLRPILCKPYKDGDGPGATYFWAEPDDGMTVTVYWEPATAAQAEEAERFYRAARGLNPDGSIDPVRLRPLPARRAEEMRLVRAVLAAPGENQPYLDYADWLERNGDPYAEYIRLSLRIEPLADDDAFRERLDTRRLDLGEKHGAKWIRGLTELGLFPGDLGERDVDDDVLGERDPDSFDPNEWFGDKGVIDFLVVPRDTFVFRTGLARLFAAAPFLRWLRVYDPAFSLADLTGAPQTAQLEHLYLIEGTATDDDVQRFADCPHFTGLRALTVWGFGLGPDAARVFAGAAWLPNLRELSLDQNTIGDAGAAALAGTERVARLENLALCDNGLTDNGLIAVCRSPHLTGLHTLHVGGNRFTAAGVRAIRDAAFAPHLRDLDLGRCELDAAALAELAAGAFPALRELHVSGQLVGDLPLQGLVAAPFFRGLETFWANGCGVGAPLVAAVAALGFVGLTELSLADNRVDAAAVGALVRSKTATTLRALHLGYNPFGSEGVVALSSVELPALRHLDLAGMPLGKEAVRALVKAPWRRNLEQLNVSEQLVGARERELLNEAFSAAVVTDEDA